MGINYKEYILSEAAVDSISADLQKYLSDLRIESRSAHRIRLTVEELLLNIMEESGSQRKISVGIGRQFGRHIFRLRYDGKPTDPVKDRDDSWSENMMKSLGFLPSWSYRGRMNTVSMILADKQKKSAAFYTVLAVILALLFGFLGRYLPEPLRQTLNNDLLTPAANGFLGLLTTFSGLMIALTICSGILGMGDTATAGRTGRSAVLRMIVLSFVISAAAAFFSLPFINLNFSAGDAGEASWLSSMGKLFFDILPLNIVDPFRTGNALQIIVIAALIGAALLMIGERGSRLRALIDESAALAQRAVSMVCSFIPLFVFAILLRVIWSGDGRRLITFIKPMLIITAAVFCCFVILWLCSAARLKCSPAALLKKTLPAFLVAFTTASSMSAMTLAMEICEQKLGVKKSLVSLIYPLGSVIYMPASIIYFTILSFTCAEIYGVEVGISWFVTAIVISTLIVIALPPIPGAGMLGFSLLFSSLGIPYEALVLATASNLFFEFYDTGFNVLLFLFRIPCEAKRLLALDRDILYK